MAEGGGLLNRYTAKSRIGGSNPPLSATLDFSHCLKGFLLEPVRILQFWLFCLLTVSSRLAADVQVFFSP